ncbi:MAG: Eco57I restriction-modification methylase domain-containing protein [Ignavibacteriae bacterium]|nr:Eco57I restriction-modification methylase domain-containing protein [Ignavibacteriota bacterium]
MSKEKLQGIINDFNPDKFGEFFREKNRNFSRTTEKLSQYNDDRFTACTKIGEIKFEDDNIIFVHTKTKNDLTERSSKKLQYEIARKILKTERFDAGIFIFYDSNGNFRFSLVYANYLGNKRDWNNFRRFTYYVNKELTNKTFLKQIGDGDFSSLTKIKEIFSITAVTNIFYDEFLKIYENIVAKVVECNDDIEIGKARDFVLLFAIRIIFIGFIQKKRWIGNDDDFLISFLKEYKRLNKNDDSFYERWLEPLFFEALNSFGKKVAYRKNDFSKELEDVLLMAPYLNGGLFRVKPGFDDKEYYIPDNEVEQFFEFLFSHSFTIEENSFEDEDLQLNPEFLGIIFERIVNKANGAVYTPRTEVDFMCRLSLVKWLEKNTSASIQKHNLYELFFREAGKGDEFEDRQKDGSFSKVEIEEILNLLENITVCDPAVGSGAFIVGMLQVLDEIIENLSKRLNLNTDDIFERKKKIISNSLYGVEVKEWAVWICQLRLWISIFIDAPDELKYSPVAILPSLEFKIRQGDSLVQRIGNKMFPVLGHADVKGRVKSKITELKKIKSDYFYNKGKLSEFIIKEKEISVYQSIIDEEIEELKESVRRKSSIEKVTKTGLFSDPKDVSSQEVLTYDENEVQDIKYRINELVEQKSNIRIDKPLIWNIEFAEIFVEKDGFDLVIGNPPYVRSEKIDDPTFKTKNKKEYKDLLGLMIRLDFPYHFKSRAKFDYKSDLYIYFYIRSLRLLNKNGYLNFICSNSWLDVGYGSCLQDFLLDYCQIDFIIDNHSKRSFESADINTIISLINAPQKKSNKSHLVKFVAFKKPFEEIVFTENMIQIDSTKEIVSNNSFRVYPISNNDLKLSGTEFINDELEQLNIGEYVGDKWGAKYLRAPEVYFKVINKNFNKLVKLKELMNILPGCYSGLNDFFYIDKGIIDKFDIEDDYVVPIIRSSKDVNSFEINISNDNYVLSIPSDDKSNLKRGVRKYIEWGEKQKTRERQKTKAGIPWPKTETVKARKYWYSIPKQNLLKTNLFMQYVANDRFYCCFSQTELTSDRCFHRLFQSNNDNLYKQILILNSTIQMFFVMLFGRASLGLGAMKFETKDAKNLISIDTEKLNISEKNALGIVDKLSKRIPFSVFVECGINPDLDIPIEEQEPNPLPDRAELDKIVFDALELTVDERKDVYRAVCRLVWNRISKAKSV